MTVGQFKTEPRRQRDVPGQADYQGVDMSKSKWPKAEFGNPPKALFVDPQSGVMYRDPAYDTARDDTAYVEGWRMCASDAGLCGAYNAANPPPRYGACVKQRRHTGKHDDMFTMPWGDRNATADDTGRDAAAEQRRVRCRHLEVVPVESGGGLVARLCRTCDTQLPA